MSLIDFCKSWRFGRNNSPYDTLLCGVWRIFCCQNVWQCLLVGLLAVNLGGWCAGLRLIFLFFNLRFVILTF
ncbi:hypothetical protein B0181_01130 [Moraxella caviae]|uniref:Uncharacterized protein n=1 Tax=Moraxella caviae TaxID=34060 RepID=A0A1T0AAY6_9GAMM|nr:hypothetical protein B0181_01130 [Moraxella caviae]